MLRKRSFLHIPSKHVTIAFYKETLFLSSHSKEKCPFSPPEVTFSFNFFTNDAALPCRFSSPPVIHIRNASGCVDNGKKMRFFLTTFSPTPFYRQTDGTQTLRHIKGDDVMGTTVTLEQHTAYQTREDGELIASFQKGDTYAADVLLTRYKDYIYRIGYRFMQNYEDTHDLVQEVLLRVFKALSRYQDRNYLKGWLYRIIANTAASIRRKRVVKEIPVDIEFERHGDTREDVAEQAEQAFLRNEIYEASNELRGNQKDVFILRYYESMSYKEIASVLSLSAASAKSTYYYAIQRIGRVLTNKGITL